MHFNGVQRLLKKTARPNKENTVQSLKLKIDIHMVVNFLQRTSLSQEPFLGWHAMIVSDAFFFFKLLEPFFPS